MYGLQAAASAMSTGSLYIAAASTVSTPGGYITLPWAAVVGGVSAVVYLGAEVAIWIDEKLNVV